jgi:uncharacterized protein YkwD
MVRLLLVVVLAAAACARPVSAPPAAAETEVITLINDRRAEASCSPVTAEQSLATAAKRHADDMRERGVRDHTGSDGSSAADRIADAGYAASRTGEILYWAQGSGSAEEAVTAWMNSPSHRDLIRECRFTHAGAAVVQANGEYSAVVDFGAR